MGALRRKCLVWAAASAAVLLPAGVAMSAQAKNPGDTGKPGDATEVTANWDTFSVEIGVRSTQVDKNGSPKGKGQDLRYRLERTQSPGGWKTSMTVLDRTQPTAKSIEGDRPVTIDPKLVPVRMEDDEDGTPVRLYDASGRRIEVPDIAALRKTGALPAVPGLPDILPSAAPRPRVTGRDWIDAVVIRKDRKDQRKRGFEQGLGRKRGEVRGLDQFVLPVPDGQQEVLVDAEFAVPMEINLVRGGTLVTRTTVSYDARPDGSLVRRTIRTEQLLEALSGQDHSAKDDPRPKAKEAPSDAGDRLITEIEFANLRLERKGGAR